MRSKKRIFAKIFSIAGLILLVIAIGGAGFAYAVLRAGQPQIEGKVKVAGLAESVTIYRDELGRPHIYASTLEDLFFGQGFAHAQDRLWQMELHRRAGQGRLSEVIGRSELNTDILLRTVGLPRVAQTLKERSSPQTVVLLESYAAGINAYLEQAKGLPPEFLLLGFRPEPWTVDHVFSVAALMAFDSARNYQNELFRLALQQHLPDHLFNEMLPPVYPENDVPAVWFGESALPFRRSDSLLSLSKRLDLAQSRYYPSLSLGSNGWSVSPEKSATGHALFAFDSHDSLSVPNLYYENRLVMEGVLDLYGWSAPGMAAMIAGFNGFIAWGMTNTGDTQDLFLEQRHPEDPRLFLYGTEWYEAEIVLDSITVKGREEPVELKIFITRNGPLISDDPPVSLAWTAYYSEAGFDALIEMNFARNWEQFQAALNKFTMPSNNVHYADVEGNVAVRTVGLLPLRRQGSGIFPSPGWDPAYGWEGFIPMDELPAVFNPPAGYVAAANAIVAREGYPYIIAVDTDPGYRMRRIVQFLEASNSHTLETMKQLQTDWYNAHAFRRLPGFLEALALHTESLSEQELAGFALLQAWAPDPVNEREKAAPAIFESWYLNLAEAVFLPEMGEELYQGFLRRNYIVYENLERFLDRGESAWFRGKPDELIVESYRRTMAQLVEKLGGASASWRWDKLQSISYNHDVGNELGPLRGIFNRGPYPTGGGHMTVGRAGHRLHRPFQVSHVATIRVVAEMGPVVEAYGVMPMGQSGHPLSSHYDDQIQAWLTGEYFPIYYHQVPPRARSLVLQPRENR